MNHRSSACGHATLCFVAFMLLLGCEGLGRPLVDKLRAPPPEPPRLCNAGLYCNDRPDLSKIAPALDTRWVDLEACGGVEVGCKLDPVTHVPGDPEEGCLHLWTLDQALAKAVKSMTYRCSALNGFATTSETVELEDVTAFTSNVTFRSEVPITIRLTRPYFADSWVSLQGPVTLSVADGWFDQVRFELDEQAEVEFERTGIERVMMAGASDSRRGTVSVRRGEIVQSHLRANDMRLESVRVTETQLDAAVLLAVDLDWLQGGLRVSEGTIGAAALTKVAVSQCDALNILESVIIESQLSPCTDLLRIYTSSAEDSWFDGPIQSDISNFTQTRFGARAMTDIAAWDSAFQQVVFCAQQRKIWVGGNTEAECTSCDLAEDSIDVCLLPEAPAIPDPGGCQELLMPPECPEPLPQRERP